MNESGVTSTFSNGDPATTLLFTEDPLTVGATAVRANHLNELRQAVKAMRETAGLPAVIFNESIDATVTFIRAIHISELRSALTEVEPRSALPQAIPMTR